MCMHTHTHTYMHTIEESSLLIRDFGSQMVPVTQLFPCLVGTQDHQVAQGAISLDLLSAKTID